MLKVGPTLILSFVILVLVLGGTGYYSVSRIFSIQQDLETVSEMQTITTALTRTSDLDEFAALKAEFDSVRERLISIDDKSQQINDLLTISNEVAELQKEKLDQDKVFDEMYPVEKESRYNIRTPLFALGNSDITKIVGDMQYYSKETLYQKSDQEHLGEWLGSIDSIGTFPEVASSSELVEELRSYKETAITMGNIAIRGEEIEAELSDKSSALQVVITMVIQETTDVIKASRDLMSSIIVVGAILGLGLGMFISRSISRRLVSLRDATEEIGKGNLEVSIETGSKDEIGDLSTSLEKMRISLKILMEEIGKKKK